MRLQRAGEGTSPAPVWRFPSKGRARWPASPCLASLEIAVGDLDVTASVDAAMEAVTSVILVSPAGARAGARRPGAVAEMSAQAFTLIADGGAGWLSDDVPSILGRPARSYSSSPTTPSHLPGC